MDDFDVCAGGLVLDALFFVLVLVLVLWDGFLHDCFVFNTSANYQGREGNEI